VIRQQDKNAFWTVIEDCLVEIFGLMRPDALFRSQKLRDVIEATPDRRHGAIFYHTEPLDVAHDIAGRQVDLSQVQEKYQAILARHNW
jgi:hypothetical protein